jgi:PhoPQ-activated pathogenicity-related protein
MSIPERHLSLFLAVVLAGAAPLRADLAGYLAKPDPSYAWESRGKTELGDTTLHDLRLTSQTWEGIVWQHNLQVFVPKNSSPAGAALLMIDGGSQGSLDKKPAGDALLYGSMLAAKIGVPCAVLKQVPNQPLLGDLKEDALIAETFRRYLDTGDDSWPLLFPMTKAAGARDGCARRILREGTSRAAREVRGDRRLQTRLDHLAERGQRSTRRGARADGHRHAQLQAADGASDQGARRVE